MTRQHFQLPPQRRAALDHLVSASVLCEHDTFLDNYDPDRGIIDIEALDGWRWSSGEQVLIDVALIIMGYNRPVQVTDLWGLDDSNRAAAVTALDIAMCGATIATVVAHPSLKAVE